MSCIVAGLIKIKDYPSKSGGAEILFLIKIQWSTPDQKILIKWGLKFLINTWSKDFVEFAWTNSACFFSYWLLDCLYKFLQVQRYWYISCSLTQDQYMMVKILAFIQQNIVASKLCLIGIFSVWIILSRVGGLVGWLD